MNKTTTCKLNQNGVLRDQNMLRTRHARVQKIQLQPNQILQVQQGARKTKTAKNNWPRRISNGALVAYLVMIAHQQGLCWSDEELGRGVLGGHGGHGGPRGPVPGASR